VGMGVGAESQGALVLLYALGGASGGWCERSRVGLGRCEGGPCDWAGLRPAAPTRCGADTAGEATRGVTARICGREGGASHAGGRSSRWAVTLREDRCGRLVGELWSGHARAAPAARDGGEGGGYDGRGPLSGAPSPLCLVLLTAQVLPCAFSSSDPRKKMPKPAVGSPTCGYTRRAAWAASSGVHNAHAPYPRAQRACTQQVVERDVVPEPGVLAGGTAKRLPPC
jgi:hypothetical protein